MGKKNDNLSNYERTHIINPPVFNLIASVWVTNPYGVESIKIDALKAVFSNLRALRVTVCFFDGVET